MFSAGVVLFEMLTGEISRELRDEHFEEDLTPDSVPEDCAKMWDEYDAMLHALDDWVRACPFTISSVLALECMPAFFAFASASTA